MPITERNITQDPDKAQLLMSTIVFRDQLTQTMARLATLCSPAAIAKAQAILRGDEK